MSDPGEIARAYYRALDDHDYDGLRELLAVDVVHRRPDRTFEGRETLVSFMRDGRPQTDTTHAVDDVFDASKADGVAVRGRLLDASEEPLFAFVDVFSVTDGAIATIETFTRHSNSGNTSSS